MEAKLLEKMKKLMNLRDRAGTEGEAQAAATQLQKLLTEHNLSVADLESKGQAAPEATQQQVDLGKAAFPWKLNLAKAVAEHFFCIALIRNKRPTFIGRPDNVESLQMTYAWLIDQIALVAREERRKHAETTGEHVDGLRWQLHFGLGAVDRLGEKLKAEKARHTVEVARNDMGDVVAMTISRTREANDYLEKHYGYRNDGQKTQHDIEQDKRWKEWEKQNAERKQIEAQLLATNPTEYYRQFPERSPTAIAKRQEQEAREREYARKREEAAEKRRCESGYYDRQQERRQARDEKYWSPEAMEKREQERRAQKVGRTAADSINITPFIGGGAPGPKKIG